MIKNLLAASFMLISINSFAQDVKKEAKSLETKMDAFVSKTGRITKYVDFSLPNLKSNYSSSETRIRKVSAGSEFLFFYQIEKKGQYSNNTASIEYSDLLEVIKAFGSLKSSVTSDIATNPDYLENKFITNDGFQVGYYVDKGKATWYLKLEKYGSDNTIFINDLTALENALIGAKAKIDELKATK